MSIRKWLESGGKGILSLCTGFGKTNTACLLIQALVDKNPHTKVLIGVPTIVLKEQWEKDLMRKKLYINCKVEVLNTIVKHPYDVDLLVIDEIHCAASVENIKIFETTNYRYLLGLTATLERLDDRHQLLLQYAPVCDEIRIEEAVRNNWLSEYRNYKVLLNVDLTEYYKWQQQFQSLFAIFNFDFKLAMECVKNKAIAARFARITGRFTQKQIIGYAASWMRALRNRKSFVMSHVKKFEVANKILDARADKKCITFSATIKDAESFKRRGLTLHSKQKKTENKQVLERFNAMDVGVLNSSKSCDCGVDIKGLSVGVILSCDSSKIRATQRIGRVIRKEAEKVAEVFTLVVQNTVEETWFNNSNENQSYITLTESQLDAVLNNGDISTRPKIGIIDKENRF